MGWMLVPRKVIIKQLLSEKTRGVHGPLKEYDDRSRANCKFSSQQDVSLVKGRCFAEEAGKIQHLASAQGWVQTSTFLTKSAMVLGETGFCCSRGKKTLLN